MKTLTGFYDPLITHTQQIGSMPCGKPTEKQRTDTNSGKDKSLSEHSSGIMTFVIHLHGSSHI